MEFLWSKLVFISPILQVPKLSLTDCPHYLGLYHLAFASKHKPLLRAIVYGIFALETIQIVMGTRTICVIFVTSFLTLLSPDNIHDQWFSVIIISGLAKYAAGVIVSIRLDWVLFHLHMVWLTTLQAFSDPINLNYSDRY
ncbi:hypothetical protein CVT25_000540 [Psilocybe cyanescens]|uniref:Uncharacterized protein n=1 Tax=Psilocybe cyanescens TaxID=93625 RepID=A0A409WZN6_PSICY|nr:hypothetical protein CVT25_000540 [Psilocybe cyanescens]